MPAARIPFPPENVSFRELLRAFVCSEGPARWKIDEVDITEREEHVPVSERKVIVVKERVR